MKNEEERLDIHLDEKVAEGVYANLALIAHSPTEFVFDFISMLPGMPRPSVRSRVVVVPEHAKRILATLQKNIEQYEENYGHIPLYDEVPMSGFGGVDGEA